MESECQFVAGDTRSQVWGFGVLTLVPGVEFLNEFDFSALVFPPEIRGRFQVENGFT